MDMKNSGSGQNPMLKHDMLPTYAPFGPSHGQPGLHSAMDFHLDAISSSGAVPSTMSMMAAEQQHHMNMAAAGIPHQFAQYSHATIPTMSAPLTGQHLAQAAAVAVVKEQVNDILIFHTNFFLSPRVVNFSRRLTGTTPSRIRTRENWKHSRNISNNDGSNLE